MTHPSPLAERLTQVVDRYVYCGGTHGPADAATRILLEPEIADALNATAATTRVRQLHQPVRWAADSPTLVCAAGCGSHPCPTINALDGAE